VNVSAIRQALGANLATTYAPLGFQVKPFALSAPAPPGFQMLFDRVDFHEELQRGELLRFILLGTVGYADDVDAQEKMDALLNDQDNVSDPLSVRQALESDQALTSRLLDDGSIVTGQPSAGQDVTVRVGAAYRLYPMQGGNQLLLGSEWTVEVVT
jgi:hypothetical protein